MKTKSLHCPPKKFKALSQAHLTDAEVNTQKNKELVAEYLKELKSRSKSDDRTTIRKITPVEKHGRIFDYEIRFQCGCTYAINAQEDLPQLIATLKK